MLSKCVIFQCISIIRVLTPSRQSRAAFFAKLFMISWNVRLCRAKDETSAHDIDLDLHLRILETISWQSVPLLYSCKPLSFSSIRIVLGSRKANGYLYRQNRNIVSALECKPYMTFAELAYLGIHDSEMGCWFFCIFCAIRAKIVLTEL